MKTSTQIFRWCTAVFVFTVALNLNLYSQYNGTYTVDPAGTQDFTTISEAVDSLESQGVTGPVTINIVAGNYNEQFGIHAISGTSATNTVTFQSETKNPEDVLIYYNGNSSNNYVIGFFGCSYVTLQYVKVFNSLPSGSYGRVIRFDGTSQYNKIKNNVIIGMSGNLTSDGQALISCDNDIISYSEISNNELLNGSYALYLYGNYAYSDEVKVYNNSCNSYAGIYAYKMDNIEITGNEINNAYGDGIYIRECRNAVKILYNDIYSSYTGSHKGIYYNDSDASIAFKGMIANNRIIVSGDYDDTNYGIYLSGSNYHQVYHNTVYLQYCNTSGAAFYADGGTNIIVKNNLFATNYYGYAYYSSDGVNITESDCNNYYTSGNYIAYWGGNMYELSNLQTANGKDANSTSVYPTFKSASAPYDLAPQTHWLDNTGTDLSTTVAFDIDSTVRPSTPDVGAMEFTAANTTTYSGTMTIGSGGNFNTFSEAIDSLGKLGVTGALTLNVIDGTYTDNIHLRAIPGASETNYITVQSVSNDSSKVTLKYAGTTADDNYVVFINGADYITLKDMTLEATGATYGRVIRLNGHASHITISNNILKGSGVANSTTDRAVISSEEDATNNLTISHNIINEGSRGIHLPGINTSDPTTSLVLANNEFHGHYTSIYLKYFTGFEIDQNTFDNFTYFGIGVQECVLTYTVSNNRLKSNVVTERGISIYDCTGSGDGGLIYNNFIDIKNSNDISGIYFRNSTYQKIIHNSIRIKSTNASSKGYYYYHYYGPTNCNNILKNNIFYVDGSGYAFYNELATAFSESDYNNFFTNGANFTRWEGTYYSSLNDYVTATSKDINSINYNPAFVSDADLHTDSYWLDGAGTPIAFVTTDIDGEIRDAMTPDIGADEYTSSSFPLQGPYTVGSGGDYTTINDAVADLILKGLLDSVVFNVLPGNYNEKVQIPQIGGVGENKRIIIQSSTGNPDDVVISYEPSGTADNYIFLLEGADYITIRNLSLNTGNSQYSRIVVINGNAQHNHIIGNKIQGRSTASSGSEDAVIFSADNSSIHGTLIQDNSISNGAYGIYLDHSNKDYGENIQIKNNTIHSYFQSMYLRYMLAPTIENNTVSFHWGGGYGMNLQYCISSANAGLSIVGNKITHITYTDYGSIYMRYCDANGTYPGLVANNVIRAGQQGQNRSIGIQINDSDYINVYNNTVNITNNQFNDIAFYATVSNNLNIINNSFSVRGEIGLEYSGLGYAFYIKDGSVTNSNYNNLYSPGRFVAYYLGTSYPTLSDLQTGSSKDANSISVFPAYNGGDDLRPVSLWMDNRGTLLPQTAYDIDGMPRDDISPDIGAYEYTSDLEPIAAGTYTIGLAGANYPSIDSAASALMKFGIAGPVVFNIKSGYYLNTNVLLKDIPGATPMDSVIFQSETGVASDVSIGFSQGLNSNFVIALNGTDYITFKNLSFSALGTDYSVIIYLSGNSQHVNFTGNTFHGINTTIGYNYYKSIVYVHPENIVDHLSFNGNTFNNNLYGISYEGYTSYNLNNILVTDNNFTGQSYAIYFYRTDAPVIKGNNIMKGLTRGILLDDCDDGIVITGNQIITSDDSYKGIEIKNCDGNSSAFGLIANNMIQTRGDGYYGEARGIELNTSSYQKIYYNTVLITGSSNNAWPFYYSYGGNNLMIMNNIFANKGGNVNTGAVSLGDLSGIVVMDYNNLYSDVDRIAKYGYDGYNTLADWQNATGLETHSVSTEPVFISESDLHLINNELTGQALPNEVLTDIDGETRDPNNPDIGADEFSCLFFKPPVVSDASACSNDDPPTLIAEGTNIVWYSNSQLTDPIWEANEYVPTLTGAGEYIYYVTQSQDECTSEAAVVTLTVWPAPELSAEIVNIDCQGTEEGSINLSISGSEGPFNYLWSNDEITQDIAGLTEGDYSVKVTDVKGCSEEGTFTVSSPTEIILQIDTQDTECNSSEGRVTVVASGGDGSFSYLWSNGETGTVIEDLSSGIYYVTVTDELGCEEIGVGTVNDIGGPEIEVESVTDVSCYGGSNGAISLSVSGGETPYEYLWSNGATTEDISQIKSGVYEVEIKDTEGCRAIESIEVDEPSPISVSLNITQSSCGQSNGAAEAVVTGGTSPYSYLWSNQVTTESITGLSKGAYSITVVDDNSCSAAKYFSVSEIGAPSVIVDSVYNGTCGNSDGAVYISVYGAYDAYTYLWSTGAETEDLVGVNPGTYNVTVSDEGGCDAVQVATIPADKPEPNPICLVSVDTATNFNEVVWEKQYTEGISHYNVYKEGSQSGVYSVVGTVGIDEESIFLDTLSNVLQRSWRYKLSVVDDCGVESDLSSHHKTIHLTINLGVNGSINLIWDHYEGFDYETYYIYRLSSAGWELIDEVPSNLTSYTDFDPILDETLFYIIEIVHPAGCDPTKSGRNTSRSNVSNGVKSSSDNTSILLLDGNNTLINLFPNPNAGVFTIAIDAFAPQNLWFAIHTLDGRLVENGYLGRVNEKDERAISVPDLKTGNYVLVIYGDTFKAVKRFNINK